MASYYSEILIEEQLSSSTSGASPRHVYLKDAAMPFQGAPWEGELQLVTTWYNAFPDATQQVLGPRDPPSQWSGSWNRNRLQTNPPTVTDDQGTTTKVADPHVLMHFLEDMFRGGRQLRVEWHTEQVGSTNNVEDKIVRVGRARKWSFKPATIFDIEWEITFEWAGRGVSTAKASSTRDDTVTAMSDKYLAAIKALKDANAFASNAKNFPSTLTLGQLESLAALPSKLTDQISRSSLQLQSELTQIQNIAKAVGQPFQVSQQSIRHARNVQLLAAANYMSLSAIPVEVLTTQSNAAAMLRAHAQFGAVQDAARAAADAAYVFGQSVRASAATFSPPLTGEHVSDQNPNPQSFLQAYVFKQGDTFQGVSQRFYGTPDHAADILRANRLAWHTVRVPAGTIVLLPRIASTTAMV